MRSDEKVALRCDIFCNIIDNYGDIGVCWRLARLLANEHGLAVRLWVDDLASFAKLCPQADVTLESQQQRGVEVCLWRKEFHPLPQPLSRARERVAERPGEGVKIEELHPSVMSADIIIAAFACKLPEPYIEAMAARQPPPVWINLEYLSAEDWVEGCHKLPSPHPRLPLNKYFFFPGFTKLTGGLLLERGLLARRDAFQNDVAAQQEFWRGIGMDMPAADTLKVSLFAYENAALPGLFDAWADGAQAVQCLVPEGRIVPQVAAYFGQHSDNVKNKNAVRAEPVEANSESAGISRSSFDKLRTNGGRGGEVWQRGNLQVCILPFVAQEDYDLLLWACDVNFVRGEDSCVRAQWAGKPFVWQIYPQHDEVHWQKLQAFLQLYHAGLSDAANLALQGLWEMWNDGAEMAGEWADFSAALGELHRHAQDWARDLSKNDLALNLLDFCRKVGTMRAFEIDGQRT